VNAIIESYLQGVSTRNLETVISHLGVNQISASYVSKVRRELDTKVQAFMERPLDSYYPYLFVDVSYFKVRDETRYINKALLIIVGVRTDGHREVLSARIADAEYELTWESMFSDLIVRGLRRLISLSRMVIRESSRQPEECFRDHRGRCATSTLSELCSGMFPGNIRRRSRRRP